MANNRLVRDKEHAMLGGVCAGIANRFALDPTIVRIATVALGILTAAVPVAVVYIALWVIMPAGEAAPHRPSRDELTDEVRDAAERIREAAQIVTAAAKQAADEISHVQGRRREDGAEASAGAASAPAEPVTPTDASATTEEQRTQQNQQQQ